MSRTSSININLLSKEHSRLDILSILLQNGWSATASGQITYTPLGDNDDYNWQSCKAEQWLQILEEIKQKELQNERIGLALYWKDSGIGGTFHLNSIEPSLESPQYNRIKLWILPYSERPRLENCGWLTDHSWFITRIMPSIFDANLFVETVECTDY
ncbi:MAG: hypothetical protein GY943_15380 [Chloroflexi bacterium]|nr:hypothetical protein [Chloroflexota bacterium]